MRRASDETAFCFFNCFGNVSSTKLSNEVPPSSSGLVRKTKEEENGALVHTDCWVSVG